MEGYRGFWGGSQWGTGGWSSRGVGLGAGRGRVGGLLCGGWSGGGFGGCAAADAVGGARLRTRRLEEEFEEAEGGVEASGWERVGEEEGEG